MSMEIHVFFRGKLPTKPVLAKAMKELGFPITIPSRRDSLEKQSGFLPMRLNREEAGAEFDVFEGRENIADIMGDEVSEVEPGFDRCGSFRFGGNENEMVTAICASAALAKLVGGVVLEGESGELMPVDEAIAWAKEIFDDWMKVKNIEAAKPKSERQPGTKPTDLKRYLRPLLEKRKDLVLVDRLLLIQPVRHLIRGVYFARSGKYDFRCWSFVNPLYAPTGLGTGDTFGDYFQVPHCDVSEPHFEPLLIDGLAEDVFATLGPIVRMNDFADFPGPNLDRTFFLGANVISLVLAGERDRAAEFVAQYENDHRHTGAAKNVIRKQWERVSGDIKNVCEEFHAIEAATVKALKLEHVWEPSPFPIELPAAERAQASEPTFSITPWIERPAWLLGEMPDRPGEACFGKEIHARDQRHLFVVPLTREEAEQRHHAGETYATAERLADGSLLMIRRTSFGLRDLGWPPNPDLPRSFSHHILWENSGLVLRSHPMTAFEDPNTVMFWTLRVRDSATQKELWFGQVDLGKGEVSVHDWQRGDQAYSSREATAPEREIARCPVPGFADHADLVARIRSLLEKTGYGPWPGGSPTP